MKLEKKYIRVFEDNLRLRMMNQLPLKVEDTFGEVCRQVEKSLNKKEFDSKDAAIKVVRDEVTSIVVEKLRTFMEIEFDAIERLTLSDLSKGVEK